MNGCFCESVKVLETENVSAYAHNFSMFCFVLLIISVVIENMAFLPKFFRIGWQQSNFLHELTLKDMGKFELYQTTLNRLRAKFFIGYINIYLHFILTWHRQLNPYSNKTRTYLLYIVNTMSVYDLVTQGARASATMIFTMLNCINLVPTCWGLTEHMTTCAHNS